MLSKLFHAQLAAVLTLLMSCSSLFAVATYRATGFATFADSNLELPRSVISGETIFSLEYTVDETAGPNTSSAARWDIATFEGFVGEQIAFSGTGGIIDLVSASDGGLGLLQWAVSPALGSDISFEGFAADLLSVDYLFVEVPIADSAVQTLVNAREFPVEEAVRVDSSGSVDSDFWQFDALSDDAFVTIQGRVDSLVLINGPDVDPPMSGGGDPMTGGGDPMTGGGDPMTGGGDPMTGGGDPMNGGGAVPEPSSGLTWLTLLTTVMFYRRHVSLRASC